MQNAAVIFFLARCLWCNMGCPKGKCWLAIIAKSFLLSKWYICMLLVKPFVVNLLVFDLIRLQMLKHAIFLCIEAHSLGFVKVMGCAQFFPNVFNSQGQWRERSIFCLTRRNWKENSTFCFHVKSKRNKKIEEDGSENPSTLFSKLKYSIRFFCLSRVKYS